MPIFKLLAKFELTDVDEKFGETFEESIEPPSIITAEKILESKISELISDFSQRGLNWILLEKCVTSESVQESDTESLNSGNGFAAILL